MAGLLRKFVKAISQAQVEPYSIIVDSQPVIVSFRRNSRAKRIVLRLTREASGVVVTLPRNVNSARAQAFVEKSLPWISKHLQQRKPPTFLAPGSTVPLRGIPHEVRATGGRRGVITIDPEACHILVPGDPLHLGRRLQDWLKAQAKADLTEASLRYARAMEASFRKISVRDQKSRWGSCSASGDLSYNWRLILAPGHILDYVAAHEVAHRLHMNHGPKFWRLVLQHCPHASAAKHWFKSNGAKLHRFAAHRAMNR
jgi:predicted metal-dependent hydrolase